jgi:hypothetical protein
MTATPVAPRPMPASPHFTAVDLRAAFNARRTGLSGTLRAVNTRDYGHGPQVFRGIPFELGPADGANVILLDKDEISLDLGGLTARYLIFLHAVEDLPPASAGELANTAPTGQEVGAVVAHYQLDYADGRQTTVPIIRRFAIQQSRHRWGASPFQAVEAHAPLVYASMSESEITGRRSFGTSGRGELRTRAGRDAFSEQLWLYALPVEHPEWPLQRLRLLPGAERVLIYGLSTTQLADHPLRPGLRQKARLALPPSATFNALDEVDGLQLDLGQIISAYRALDYNPTVWNSLAADVQPVGAEAHAIVEYTAHPAARLHAPTEQTDVAALLASGRLEAIPPADRPVRLRVLDKATGQLVACRLHAHGAAGENLPPRGHHRKTNPYWFEDNYAEFQNGRNAYSYIPGEAIVDLPLGSVYVEASRGYEVMPFRGQLQVGPATDTLTIELERALPWRDAGWVTADTHVHFLSPQTALLEGTAEGVNVVNLLASQWGEMFSNVGDYDGRTVLGAREFGGSGEFLVKVGTENRQQIMGHISLLGYSGPMIHPLCTGGPSESAVGDPLEVGMAEWAERCIQQGGLVVMPHAPDPQAERAANIVAGLVHAIEMCTFNPYDAQVSPVGLADWYRFLNLGYHLPVAGGSDKMAATMVLGGIRTYAQLGDRPFTYENWMKAVRGGDTFVTVGPLVRLTVEGLHPGQTLRLPPGGGTLNVAWTVDSVLVPIEQIELVLGGRAVETSSGLPAGQPPYHLSGDAQLRVNESSWVAVRVRGSYRGRPGDIAAHTSVVQVLVGEQPIFSASDAAGVLRQIEGVLTYVNELAPRSAPANEQKIRQSLISAHAQLHAAMHQAGHAHGHRH